MAVLCLCFVAPRADGKKSEEKLWAAISVNQPVFQPGSTESLQLDFAIVNDGKTMVDPKIDSSRLFINDKELKDWDFIVGNGPRGSNYNALPSGDFTNFGYAMGNRFKTPGIYKVRWEGENFKAPEITFRVLPRPKK